MFIDLDSSTAAKKSLKQDASIESSHCRNTCLPTTCRTPNRAQSAPQSHENAASTRKEIRVEDQGSGTRHEAANDQVASHPTGHACMHACGHSLVLS